MDIASVARTVIQLDVADNYLKPKVVQLGDFFWDKVISTMIALIFGVTSVQAIVSYLIDGGLSCVIEETHTTSMQEYINQLCQKDVPRYAQFYNIALYAEVAFLSGLHVFWSHVWSGRIESFKSTVASMDLTRDKISGQFKSSDFDLARYLERNLQTTTLTWTYMLKTGGQILVCSLCIYFLTFFPHLEFNGVSSTLAFVCFNDSTVDGRWPLVEKGSVFCALSELSRPQILRWFNLGALIVIVLSAIVSTFLTAFIHYYYHLLDYKRVAKFILHTGLRRDHYPEHHYNHCSKIYGMCCTGSGHFNEFMVYSIFWCWKKEIIETATIPFDMKFLITRLYASDTKKGEALLNVLIDNHIDYLIKNECIRSVRDPCLDNAASNSLGTIIVAGIIRTILLLQINNLKFLLLYCF